MSERINRPCLMRHENGNCISCGVFCTTVSDEICDALNNAFQKGYSTGVEYALSNDIQISFERIWIPVKMFNPISDGRYMVTLKGSRGKYRTEMRNYNVASGTWEHNKDFGEIIAWQNRPAPYLPKRQGGKVDEKGLL